MKTTKGKATVTKNGDVTTVRIVDFHGEPTPPPTDPVKLPPAPPDLATLKAIDVLGFNAAAEKIFVQMLLDLCEKVPDGVPVVGLRAETAYRLGISTETAKRYIEKWCYAFSAPFFIRDGFIFRKQKEQQDE